MIELAAHPRGTILPVRARPGGRRDAIVGEHAGALRVSVSAAPERGKANAAILDVLAEALRSKPSRIDLLSGETSREKRFLIVGMTPEQVRERLAPLIEKQQ